MDEQTKQLIREYKPNQQTLKILRNKQLVIVAGITGAGKNTIMNELLKKGEFYDLVTSTTREPRSNDGIMETDGVDYYFLTRDDAVSKIKAGEYVEVAVVHDHINGVLVEELQRAQDKGKIPVVDIDVQGVETFNKLSDNVIAIFVVPPSYEEWVRRIKNRYATEEAFAAAWPARRASAVMELETALSKPYYHFIVNENVDEAARAVDRIAHKHNEFSQIDRSFHVWAERILADLKTDCK